MQPAHTFHIPVLGIGYSLDTPVKVAKYGISSVMSIVDDQTIEQLREYYCRQRNQPYEPITDDDQDPRAHRITAYLNLVSTLVRERSEALRSSPFEPGSDITTYFELLPDESSLRRKYNAMLACADSAQRKRQQDELRAAVIPGDIDVNIMVKVDKDNYRDGEKLPPEFADAMSALRGYALSELDSSIVLSAGFNRRLARYMETFADFHADAEGNFKKRITLKVSDFRSALTQAKMFARNGLWISEFRIESGLNCGGHTFATDGHLLGPVLEEFKTRRGELRESVYAIYADAVVKRSGRTPPEPSFRVTAQGGVGTAREHRFLLEYYAIDGVGWGSPFLLVPECVNVDPHTLDRLAAAGEEQIVSSGASPLGVPFSNLVDSASEVRKYELERRGTPGSSCPKGFLKFNTEFTKLPICIASSAYQRRKLKQLDAQRLTKAEHSRHRQKIIERACLCRDLSGAITLNNQLGRAPAMATPAVCPGPNLAFFSRIATLQEMVDHIYGRFNLLTTGKRPHMFVNELKLYIADLGRAALQQIRDAGARSAEQFSSYRANLQEGIEYYRKLARSLGDEYSQWRQALLSDVEAAARQLDEIIADYPALVTAEAATGA